MIIPLNWQPHLHLLVTDGAFRLDGTFLHLGFHEIEILAEAFRRAVLREFVRRELLDPEVTVAILRHLRRHGRDPDAMYDELLGESGRGPP